MGPRPRQGRNRRGGVDTPMAEADGKPVCGVVPSDGEVSKKRLAAAFGGKSVQMMLPTDAARLTGYRIGGIYGYLLYVGQTTPSLTTQYAASADGVRPWWWTERAI